MMVTSGIQTIQFAISQCPSGAQDVGQTIWIMAGLYVENLVISDKNIKGTPHFANAAKGC
jgi:pectin methylesterase-like acyl-CoA thioesterase